MDSIAVLITYDRIQIASQDGNAIFLGNFRNKISKAVILWALNCVWRLLRQFGPTQFSSLMPKNRQSDGILSQADPIVVAERCAPTDTLERRNPMKSARRAFRKVIPILQTML
ncbi:hypothetical protein HED52_17685 [Ochrobactrum ciceri]|uniref:Uncharacterized protein n=1 Tax=Brucella ciceri TaxID=391287 RepID=A0ABX1DVB7_9HYPH|nr:hypothetical protein [Brucella ciceri]